MSNKKLNAVITIGGAVTSGLRSAVGTTVDGLRRIGTAVRDVQRQQRDVGAAVEANWRVGRSVADLERQYERLGRRMDSLRAAQRRLAANSDAIAANNARRSQIGGSIRGTVGAAAGAALPLGAALMKSVEFDYQMRLIGNTAEMTQAQVNALSGAILKISKDTNQSAQETQKGLGFLIAAGMPLATAQKTIGTVGKAATATGGDIEDLARAAFTLNDSLKIAPGETMEQALDTLAKAGKEGNVELKDMAKVLPVLGGGFVALKMQGREAAATIGAALQIARKGTDSAEKAATNMENFIGKIMSPETLKKAKKNFNLDLYKVITDAQTTGKNPFDEAMIAIMKATKGDQKAIGDLFQDMQVQNFIRPMIQNWDKYKEIKDKSLKADGTVERDFQTMLKTSKERINALTQSFGRLGIAIGQAISGQVGEGEVTFFDKAAQWITVNRELTGTIIKVGAALVGLRLVQLAATYGFTLMRGAMLGVQGVMARVGATMAVLGAPMWVVVAGAAALAVAGAAVYKFWEPLKAFFVGFGEGFMQGMAPVKKVFEDAFGPVEPIVTGIKNAIGALFEPISQVSGVTTAFGNAGKIAGEAVAGAFRLALLPLTTMVQTITWLRDNIGGVLNKVGGAFKNTSAAMAEDGMQYDANGNSTGMGPPTIPPMRGAAAAGGGAVSQTNTYHITQLPGESAEALARRVAEINKRQDGVNRRSGMTDGAQ